MATRLLKSRSETPKNITVGATVDKLAITLPKTLNQTINGIAVRDNKSRSMVIAELIEKGLNSNE